MAKLDDIEKKIIAIKQKLQEIGEMRPGSLTTQYKNPKDKTVPFYQLSYTHNMKSKSEYVRPQLADDIKQQIKTYKLFRNLVEQWVDLAIEYSKTKMDIAKRSMLK